MKTTLNVLYLHIKNPLYLFITTDFIYIPNYLFTTSPSFALVKDPFARNLTTIITYVYVLF